MPKFNIEIDGIRGEAIERYAQLAGKAPEDQIKEWLKDKVDYATVTAMRAARNRWEDIANALGYSTTQVRRIYAQGTDLPIVTKEGVRVLERYVDLMERAEAIHLRIPDEEDISTVESLTGALEAASEAREGIWIPSEFDIESVERYSSAVDAAVEAASEAREGIWIPTETDIESVERYSSAIPKND